MNNAAFAPKLGSSSWEPKFPFDLVVAYEDVETRHRALHLYDHLAQQLLDDYDFQCSWWKFDHLANAVLRQQAADAAVDANMVILSMRAHRDLPAIHRQWLEDWVARRGRRKAALVVLIAGTSQPDRDAAELLSSLRGIARAGGMDFFPHAFELPSDAVATSTATMAPPPASVPKPILQGILQHKSPVPRWGINE